MSRNPFAFARVAVPLSTALLLALSLSAPAAGERDGFRNLHALSRLEGRARTILVEPSIRLERIRPDEILAGGLHQAISLGRWRRGASLPYLQSGQVRIVRSVPSVWRMRVTDEESIGALDVRYEITAPDGRAGRLGATNGSRSEIRTTLRSTPPIVAYRDAEGAVIEGGLTLYLDLDSVQSAGTYSGTITVTIDHF